MTSKKGMHFEARVERRLNANFPEAVILHDVSIPGRKRKPTQIDFVMLDETGVYVIEAKGYSGRVEGKASDVFWRKTLKDKNGNERSILVMNPIVQNAGHVKYVRKLINDPSISVFSIAVLSEKCDFSKIDTSEEEAFMFHLKEFTQRIKEIMDISDSCLSYIQIEEILRKLS